MRLKVLIRSDLVPILYRHRVVSLIKNAIKLGSNGVDQFFEDKRVVRPYCFNLALPSKKTQKVGTIQIDENFTVEDIIFYTNGIYSFNYFTYRNYSKWTYGKW